MKSPRTKNIQARVWANRAIGMTYRCPVPCTLRHALKVIRGYNKKNDANFSLNPRHWVPNVVTRRIRSRNIFKRL